MSREIASSVTSRHVACRLPDSELSKETERADPSPLQNKSHIFGDSIDVRRKGDLHFSLSSFHFSMCGSVKALSLFVVRRAVQGCPVELRWTCTGCVVH